MMGKLRLLDCTLRDGGYYTNWDFEEALCNEYFKSMEALQVEYVEIGYRSPELKGYFGKYFYCPIEVMLEAQAQMPSKKLAVILNEKDVRPNQLESILGPCKGILSMIRLAVDPKNIVRALELATSIKNMGFEVAFNVMYMSKWVGDIDFLNKLSGIEKSLDVLYMVDSFGGVYPDEVATLTKEIRKRTSIPLGFHGHNNIELALINTITAINCGCEFVDSTITGMGRGAGNLKTELLLTYLQSKGEITIDFFKLAGITQAFERLQSQYKWGTSMPYMFSGAHSLAQKNVMEWLSKDRYSFGEIIYALNKDTALEKDPTFLSVSDLEISSKAVFIIGGGLSVKQHFQAIEQLINQYQDDVVIVHAGSKYFNHLEGVTVRQICCLVGKEGHRLSQSVSESSQDFQCILVGGGLVPHAYVPPQLKSKTYQLNEIDITEKYLDSPLAISLTFAYKKGFESIFLIGFDGYSGSSLSRVEIELANENQWILDRIPNDLKETIVSLTPTNYKNVKVESIYGHLCRQEKL
ncbi:MAG: aldolase catalytic domain-containing protein [Cyclobacteriaceae bacterium]